MVLLPLGLRACAHPSDPLTEPRIGAISPFCCGLRASLHRSQHCPRAFTSLMSITGTGPLNTPEIISAAWLQINNCLVPST